MRRSPLPLSPFFSSRAFSSFTASKHAVFSRGSFKSHKHLFGSHGKRLLVGDGMFQKSVMLSAPRFYTTSHNEEETVESYESHPPSQSEAALEPINEATQPDAVVPDVEIESSFFEKITGPVQDAIIWLHDATGTPYWLAIIGLTMAIRTAILPLAITAHRNGEKMKACQPELTALKKRLMAKGGAQNTEAAAEYREQTALVFKKHGTNPAKALVMPIVQIPVFITFFFALRDLSAHAPGLENGGILWFTNLASPDPLYITPLISALTLWATIELPAMYSTVQQPAAVKWVGRVMAPLLFVIGMNFDQAVHMYWATSNFYSMAQTYAFHRPSVRKMLGLKAVVAEKEAPTIATEDFFSPKKGTPIRSQRRKKKRN